MSEDSCIRKQKSDSFPRIIGHCELCGANFNSFRLLSVPFIGKTEERTVTTRMLAKRRKEGTLDTESKNGCFRWTWLMNWAVWKLRNEISFTEGIQDINHSNRQAVSSHQDNIDTFLYGVSSSIALQKLAPKLVNQLYLFYEMFGTRSSHLQILLWRNH